MSDPRDACRRDHQQNADSYISSFHGESSARGVIALAIAILGTIRARKFYSLFSTIDGQPQAGWEFRV
jgi:hypothetical protein